VRGAVRVRAALLCAACAAGCAAALEPRTIAFSYDAPEPPSRARIGSYEQASAAIAAAFEHDLGFPAFMATLRLFPDARSFEAALLDVGYEPALARDTARVMAGVGGHRGVLLNESMLAPLSWPDRVALLAHELTHSLQYELGGGRRGASDQWLREGFAEWVAMRVLVRLETMKPADYRRVKVEQLRATSAAKAPRLDDMATFPQLVALAARDDIAPYAQAFLAVDLLIERHGRPAVIRYFELFAASDDRRGNFAAAFGEDLGAFEAVLRERLWPGRSDTPIARTGSGPGR
jgi:hypothetical protein